MYLPSHLQDFIVEQHPLLPGECHGRCSLHGVTVDTCSTFIFRLRQHPAFTLKMDAKGDLLSGDSFGQVVLDTVVDVEAVVRVAWPAIQRGINA